MEVNNFKQIEDLIEIKEYSNKFLHCQIVARAKDHKGDGKKVKEGAIKTYFIRSAEHLKSVEDEIKLLCDFYGARAYINLATKNFERLNKDLLVELAEMVSTNNLKRNPRRIMNHLAGKLTSENPIWVVDVDDVSMENDIKEYIYFLFAKGNIPNEQDIHPDVLKEWDRLSDEPYENYIIARIPTLNGIHLLTRGFNLKAFQEKFPNVDVHKNSMGTVLYVPNFK